LFLTFGIYIIKCIKTWY